MHPRTQEVVTSLANCLRRVECCPYEGETNDPQHRTRGIHAGNARPRFGLLALRTRGAEVQAQGQTGTCPNARLIDEFTGTGSQTSDTFDTTTGSFRITYDLEATGENTVLDPNLLLSVNNEEGLPVENASQDGAGTGETFVNEPPGTYSLEIDLVGEGQYTVTVEQCEGGNPTTNPDPGTPKTPPAPPKTPATPPKTPSPAPKAPSPPPEQGTLMNAGGATAGPMPIMPDGSCPREYPTLRNGACYL